MTNTNEKYRLITRSDFDGLVCAVLLKDLGLIDKILFVHPKDMQDGKIEVGPLDITTNLPYVEGCHLAFDHHASEAIRNKANMVENYVLHPQADSAARVVYDYYGGFSRFPHIDKGMMEAVDKADSAKFSMEDVLNPQGWELLSFLMDARTGLGRFHSFKVSNYHLMMDLIEYCKNHTIEEIFLLPDVQERVELYRKYEQQFKDQLLRCSTVSNHLVVLDLRNEETIYPGNRFMIYALFPKTSISIHVIWGFQKQNTVFACGKSIFNKSSRTNIGLLMLEYEGGGHEAAGTCQIAHDQAEQVLLELKEKISRDG